METNSPSDARNEALDAHEALKEQCREVLELARRAEDGSDRVARRRLAAQISALVSAIRSNLGSEGETLRPLVEAADLWGPHRARQLDDSHAHQEGAAADAEVDVADADPEKLVITARCLVRELVRALRWEARDILGPELLRDDMINIDQESG